MKVCAWYFLAGEKNPHFCRFWYKNLTWSHY